MENMTLAENELVTGSPFFSRAANILRFFDKA